MFVIRKKLYASEGTDPNTRYDEDCECVQSTFDGGVTWVDNPAADPRTSAAFLNPAPADDVCAAAQGISNFVRAYVDGILINFNGIAVAAWSIQIALLFLPPLALLYRVAWLVGEGVITIGALTLDEAFDETVYDQLRDIAFCHLNAEGKFDDQAAFDAFGEQIQEDISNGAVNVLMALMFNMYGWVGFSNAALKYAEGADCSGADCGWEYCWSSALANLDDWTPVSYAGFTNQPSGVLDGSGWNSRSITVAPGASGNCHYDVLSLRIEFGSTRLTEVSTVFDRTFGSVNGSCQAGQPTVAITIFNGVTQVGSATSGSTTSGTDLNAGWEGDVTATEVEVRWTASFWRPSLGGSAGSALLKSVRLAGFETPPFGENNCE